MNQAVDGVMVPVSIKDVGCGFDLRTYERTSSLSCEVSPFKIRVLCGPVGINQIITMVNWDPGSVLLKQHRWNQPQVKEDV